MKTSTPLVSIIIPLYNYEEYVAKCLDSIKKQTYHNIEAIVVDDGSTDDSGIIADRYAASDDRIIVFHKENGGIGSAIQKGLEMSSGEYVAFLDSDDYMEPEAYAELVDIAEKSDVDFVYFGLNMYGIDGRLRGRSICKHQYLKSRAEIIEDYLWGDRITPLSRKFCKKELLMDLSMMQYSAGIDETISIQIVMRSNRALKVEKCYYNAVGEPQKDSVSRRIIDGKEIDRMMKMHEDILNYISLKNSDYKTMYNFLYLKFLIGRYVVIWNEKRNSRELQLIYDGFLKWHMGMEQIRNIKLSVSREVTAIIQFYVFKKKPSVYAAVRGLGYKKR